MMDSGAVFIQMMKPYHVRTGRNAPWQQCFAHNIINPPGIGLRDGSYDLRIQHMTDSTEVIRNCFSYKLTKFPKSTIKNVVLLDEVNKKLYFFHSPNVDSQLIVREATAEILEFPHGNRVVMGIHSVRLFLGHYRSDVGLSQWFMNPVDGSIFQIYSNSPGNFNSSHTISWVKLDDSVQVESPYSDVQYDGKVKVMAKYKLDFGRHNLVDYYECGILFSKNGKKMLIRFRVANPEHHVMPANPPHSGLLHMQEQVQEAMTTPESAYTHQMALPPTYALFTLDYDTHGIQLLTQFEPSSQENHAHLLISARLLPLYAKGIGFPNSKAQSYLSQRSYMLGTYLKYTFFSTINKGTIGIVAVKSLMSALQYSRWSKMPKKVWFPLEDEKFKTAFANLSDNKIKWEMLAQKNNFMLVFGNEFILQIYHPIVNNIQQNPTEQLATIRVKLGIEYKDYRECAGCAKVEQYKRRSKNGKRMSQFKVCGWCKDHNLHKMLEVPCHYCSETCADSHWPIHQLEHKVKGKGKKGKNMSKK